MAKRGSNEMQHDREAAQTDVVIVGGGPVGLGLAIDLALRGIKSIVVEQTTTLHRIPKGQNLTQRTGEHFRTWGMSQQIRDASVIPRSFGNEGVTAYGSLFGDYVYDWFRRSAVGQFYFAENERLPQYCMEAVLRTRADELDAITTRYGWLAEHLSQDGDGATLQIRDVAGAAQEVLRGKYIVGADGARSTVRQQAGIEQDIEEHDQHMALLVFQSEELHHLLERLPGKSIFNIMRPELQGYWQFLGRVDVGKTWFYHAPLPKETTVDNFDFEAYLQDAIGAEFAIKFNHIGFWDLRLSVARSYRNDRLFVVGDAAHSHPPYGGYGVNTGFEDACNLSWKLAATLQGWAGGGLLDSYTSERKPVFEATAEEFIGRMIRDDRTFLQTYSPSGDRAAFEAAWAGRAAGGNADVTEYVPHYEGSPIVCGEAGATCGARGKHVFAARAGHHLAPQQLRDTPDLFAALGGGFALLNLGEPSDVEGRFRKAADDLAVPLAITSDTPASGANAYEARYILVRPDHFVAWVGDDPDGGEANILKSVVGA
ncbi:MAG: FAD-dependent monooxygenase [Hyphomicrobiaceae bacterium]